MSTIIQLTDVSKTFEQDGHDVHALKGVNLAINQGEIFAIIGHSGAGKSTLIRLINGLERVSNGTIVVDGTDISTLPESQLRKVRLNTGMIFQQFNLFNARTVAGNVAYPLRVAGWSKQERDARVAELLDFVGLLDRAYAYPDQLSGGQKQRVGIARALATSPPILLADEATSALDPETTADVLRLLSRVNKELGVTIVLVTHEMDVVRTIADRVAVISDGHIVEQGSAFDVFSRPQSETAKAFVASSLHDTPSSDDLARLRSRHRGRIVIADVVDDANIGGILSQAAVQHVSFELLYGGISSLQGRSFGSLTTALDGADADVERVVGQLRAVTRVAEVAA